MTKLYKLTDENNQTHNKTQWGENVTHEATGSILQELCSDGWIHAYESPYLAVLLNPIHGNFKKPNLWEAEGEINKRDFQLKVGCRTLTTLKKIPLPVVTTEQRVTFAIKCALSVCKNPIFMDWADKWLKNEDRSMEAVEAAVEAATAMEAVWAAAAAAEAKAVEWAAEAAVWAAKAAAEAKAVEWAAEAAVWAAEQTTKLNLISLAEEVCG